MPAVFDRVWDMLRLAVDVPYWDPYGALCFLFVVMVFVGIVTKNIMD